MKKINISNNSFLSLSSDEVNRIEEFRKSKQTALLAILFSDVVNSTYATEKLGEEAYSKLRHIHDELFIRIMTRENLGIIVKEIGDSFLCVFSEPSTAVLCAIKFQRAIHSNKEHLTVDDYTLTVKIGIHLGQVVVENTLALDIFGSHVNRAARIEALANGGQILTSQSIWENAFGWLKDSDEKNIEWLYYGKTKLKGIDKRVDIYGFYPKEIGKSASPNVFKKQKQKRRIFILSALLLLLVLSFFSVKRINAIKHETLTSGLNETGKSYYIQFDFSNISKSGLISDNLKSIIIDTISLKENLTAQVIALLYPDSVITESDLIELYAKKGGFFTRRDLYDHGYWDSLHLSNRVFIKFKVDSIQRIDSVCLEIYSNILSQTGAISSLSDEVLSVKNIVTDFRNMLQEDLMNSKLAAATGTVLNYKDSILFFQVGDGAKLRTGMSLKITRNYPGKKGLDLWLSDIQEEIDFYKSKPQDSEKLKNAINKYSEVKMIPTFINIKRAVFGAKITGTGRVIELYDSTAKASFINKGGVPWDVPRKGDMISLSY